MEDVTATDRSKSGVKRATGRDRKEWFALLDDWGAGGREYREIADWLVGQHSLSDWWAQKLIVEYQQARGTRPPGKRPDGTFTVSASKTVGVPVERAWAAFFDADLRSGWLPGVVLRERTSQPERSARFDWDDGSTRVNVGFESKGDAKSHMAVEHERLPDVGTAAAMKIYWQERLAALDIFLES